MKTNRLYIFLILIVSLIIVNCRKDSDNFIPDNDNGGGKFVSTVSGYVLDEANQIVVGADVESNGKRTTTNNEGFFIIKDVSSSNTLKVIIQKDGYFKGCRTLFISKNNIYDVKVTLLRKEFSQSFQSNTGGKVVLGNKMTINFEANSIVTEAGNAYNGIVKVAMKYLNPRESNIASIMPGALAGLDTNNQLKALISYGMIGVELEGNSGQKLQIKQGSTASISVLIPESLQLSAPKSIPLWSFNYDTGLWKEEGVAIFDGENYVGKVSHFSFWNCDVPNDFIRLKGKVVYADGSPFQGVVKLTILGSNTSSIFPYAFTYTNIDGEFEGRAPRNTKFLMQVNEHNCSEVLYESEIGPFDNDVTLSTISIKSNNNSLIVTGKVFGCNGTDLLKNGLVTIFDNSKKILKYTYTDNEGLFSLTLNNCSLLEIKLTAYDIVNLQKSKEILIPIKSGKYELSDISTCDQIDEYLTIKNTAGIDTIITDLYVQDSTNKSLSLFSNVNGKSIYLIINTSIQSNIKEISNFTYYANNSNFNISNTNKPTINIVNLKKYPIQNGEYFEGDYKINNISKNGTQELHEFSGNFRIKKK
ncbi:MAG: carboxypeptidase regulatory-like domain-containing protein [Saprospiraceae bacterium]|nr:carboxypeptidase regulatory-like domain-containing protein [Saprospiraceae bacterium]